MPTADWNSRARDNKERQQQTASVSSALVSKRFVFLQNLRTYLSTNDRINAFLKLTDIPRNKTLYPIKPSLPPAALAGEVQRTSSPALSTSSTVDEGTRSSSPVLPPIPQPTFNGHIVDLITRTPPPVITTEQSSYYTASWGSPYRKSPTSRLLLHDHVQTPLSEASSDSPIHHLEFHTPFLRPAPTIGNLNPEQEVVAQEGAISAAVLANRARRGKTGLTEDWIRKHTGGESAERNHWLSDADSSGDSSGSGSISDPFNWALSEEHDIQTPTVETYMEAKFAEALRNGHRRQLTATTLRQEDFDMASESSINMAMSLEEVDMASNNEKDNEPPSPISRERCSDTPASVLGSPSSARLELATTLPQRIKKKIAWKGKNILVLFPPPFDAEGNATSKLPMREKDVKEMLRKWELIGHNTRGFDLVPGLAIDEEAAPGQSRLSWPSEEDICAERLTKCIRVQIPDKREWDIYVLELQEAKLRALGVSLGDDDLAPPNQAAFPSLIRQTSYQYPSLPFSPPIPSSSAGSGHAHPNSFSPIFMSGTGFTANQGSNTGSNSPLMINAPINGLIHGKYNSRHSISFSSNEHPFGSPFQYPQQSPMIWSPGQKFHQQGSNARGRSPSLHNIGSIMSPVSPFPQDSYFPQNTDNSLQSQQRQNLLPSQTSQQQLQITSSQTSPRLQEVKEREDEDDLLIQDHQSKTPESSMQCSNAITGLKEEVDEAEYHLEEQIQRELEHEDYSPHSLKGDVPKLSSSTAHVRHSSLISGGLAASKYATELPEEGPVLHHPQPYSRGHTLSQVTFQDKVENPNESKDLKQSGVTRKQDDLPDICSSNLETPTLKALTTSGHSQKLSLSNNPWIRESRDVGADQSHQTRGRSKTLASKLNVTAKEFTFNPSSSFTPLSALPLPIKPYQNRPFIPNKFLPYMNNILPSGGVPPIQASPKAIPNSCDIPRRQFDLTAPTFNPRNNEFNFSTIMPNSIPCFNPSITYTNQSSNHPPISARVDADSKAIFSNIDLSGLENSKPIKKSRAIPIVRPSGSNPRALEDEVVEGVDGRITQGEGRVKRVRGNKSDQNSVPLFASLDNQHKDVETNQASQDNLVVPNSPKNTDLPVNASQKDEIGHQLQPRDISFELKLSNNDLCQLPPMEENISNLRTTLPEELKIYKTDDLIQEHREKSEVEEHEYTEEPLLNKDHQQKISPSPEKAQALHLNSTPKSPVLEKTSKQNPVKEESLSSTMPRIPSLTHHTSLLPHLPPLPKLVGLSGSRFAKCSTPSDEANMEKNNVTLDKIASPSKLLVPQSDEIQKNLSSGEEKLSHDEKSHGKIVNYSEAPYKDTDILVDHNRDQVAESFNPVKQVESEVPKHHEPNRVRCIKVPDLDSSPPVRPSSNHSFRSAAPSPSPTLRRNSQPKKKGFQNLQNSEMTISPTSHPAQIEDNLPISEWDCTLSEVDKTSRHARAPLLKKHIYQVVGSALSEKLGPLERTLENIQVSISVINPSNPRDYKSNSVARSDADDEDEVVGSPKPSFCSRRDKKLDQMKSIIQEALAASNVFKYQRDSIDKNIASEGLPLILDELKHQFSKSSLFNCNIEDFREMLQESVQQMIPVVHQGMIGDGKSSNNLQNKSKVAKLEEKLQLVDREHKSLMTVMKDQASRAETRLEEEMQNRRIAEDHLSDIQRQLRISSEEERRLRTLLDQRETKIREILDESDSKVRLTEEKYNQSIMRIAAVESAHNQVKKNESDLLDRLHLTEADLSISRQETQRWQLEAERALAAVCRQSEDAEQANEKNKELYRKIEALKIQSEESIRIREVMRGKLIDLQEDMAHVAGQISDENTRHTKKEQELIARQEVLDARLQAEGRTRERLETEIERLERGEREALRAVNDCKKMEALVEELKENLHLSQKDAMRYQRELEDTKEAGLSQLERTRQYMQAEIDVAKSQSEIMQKSLENQMSILRADVDHTKLEADTARERSEMLIEEAEMTKKSLVSSLELKLIETVEDLKTQHDRQLQNTLENAQRHEQHLLDRLSLSSAKTEHLQDRIAHLEEKLEIANTAATAAASAAKIARSKSNASPHPQASVYSSQLVSTPDTQRPEKISPQALRESIISLQEQLQERESTIESLTSVLSSVDPDAAAKISKRDDEIMWLRELLAVRMSDLTDIVQSLEQDQWDVQRVKDAAIRLRTNLQMQEQELERAMNGGSALNLPNIASLMDAASPRVAQAVGPLAAAWGNWRKSKAEKAPSKNKSSTISLTKDVGAISGSSTPLVPNRQDSQSYQNPTAFSSTGQRFTPAQLANRPRVPIRGMPPKKIGVSDGLRIKNDSEMSSRSLETSPMLKKSSYDQDATEEEFSDAGFFDDDGSAE
ncbi:myosin class II heavy chain (MHC) [Blumeria hordei DH14]|uniref:Myosin class II heavy chain (MHC) n=1 Tax=Blumeria graminis f. sp. hordei (strain DH14) TaxID=546991 RepID=N1JFU8_BLUG1|nr:myosin class II heavy chain (MHC) [Blumeria hordei DH14]